MSGASAAGGGGAPVSAADVAAVLSREFGRTWDAAKDSDEQVSGAFMKYVRAIAEQTGGGDDGHGHAHGGGDDHHGHSHAGGVCGPAEDDGGDDHHGHSHDGPGGGHGGHGHSHGGDDGDDQHGHSHGAPAAAAPKKGKGKAKGHGHSHGGDDDGHGHSHGGHGGGHGHSHGGGGGGGGGARARMAALEEALAGGGEHGHSHGGVPCGGHGGPPQPKPKQQPALPGSKKLVSFFAPLPSGANERKQALQALLHIATLTRDRSQLPAAAILAHPPVNGIAALASVVTECAQHLDNTQPLPLTANTLARLKEQVKGDAKKFEAEKKRLEAPKPSKLKLSADELESACAYALSALADYTLMAPVREVLHASRDAMLHGAQRVVAHHAHVTRNRAVLYQALRLVSNLARTQDANRETFFGWDFLDALPKLLADPSAGVAAAAPAAGADAKDGKAAAAAGAPLWRADDIRREAARAAGALATVNGQAGAYLHSKQLHTQVAQLLVAAVPKADAKAAAAAADAKAAPGAELVVTDDSAYYACALLTLSVTPAVYKELSGAARVAMCRVAFAIAAKPDSHYHVAAISALVPALTNPLLHDAVSQYLTQFGPDAGFNGWVSLAAGAPATVPGAAADDDDDADISLPVNVLGGLARLARTAAGAQCITRTASSAAALAAATNALLTKRWALNPHNDSVALALLELYGRIVVVPACVDALKPLLAPNLFKRWTPLLRTACALRAPERLGDINALNRAFPPAGVTAAETVNAEGKTVGICAVCAAPAVNLCGRCKGVFYCTADHQKLDWKAGHKTTCKPAPAPAPAAAQPAAAPAQPAAAPAS